MKAKLVLAAAVLGVSPTVLLMSPTMLLAYPIFAKLAKLAKKLIERE